MPPKKKKVSKAADDGPVKEVRRRKACPDCGSANIMFDPDTEQLICHDCGLLFEELPADLEKRYEAVDLL